MDPDALDTLPDATFSDGMAEVIKYGCIWDKDFFDFLAAHPSRAQIMEHIEHVLYTCCDIKRQVVEADELDTGLRMILNFGHTIGHAFELAGHYERWTHGQAVAAGMNWAAQLGQAMAVTPAGTADAIVSLTGAFGLPSDIPCPWALLAEAVGLDKKGSGDSITLILLSQLGKTAPTHLKKDELLRLLKPMAEERGIS
jgi:3-dehydroquinate synthase